MQAQRFLKDEGISRYFEDFRGRCAPQIGEGISAEMQAQWFLKDEGVSRYFEDFRGRCAPQIGAESGAVVEQQTLSTARVGLAD